MGNSLSVVGACWHCLTSTEITSGLGVHRTVEQAVEVARKARVSGSYYFIRSPPHDKITVKKMETVAVRLLPATTGA